MSTTFIESTNGTVRVRWYSIAALVLVPVLLAGGVLLAVHDYSSKLGSVSAAIVNNDDGTEIDGQTVPLGRQLSAALVKGAANDVGVDGNYDWVLTDDADADSGLADGLYAVVVKIPKDFSENATSFSDAETATQATVSVETSNQSLVADDAISTIIASAATRSFGTELSTQYLDGIYIGFNTLNDQLGEAADGAEELADGAHQASDGTVELADGADDISSGTGELSDGIGQLATGARQSATGAKTFAKGLGQFTDGTTSLSDGLGQLADGTADLPAQVDALADGSAGIAAGVDGIAQIAAAQPDMTLAQLDAYLTSQGGSLADLSSGASQLSGGLSQFSAGVPAITDGIAASADGAKALSKNGKKLSSGADDLADGLDQLADGVEATDAGAATLDSGIADFADGVRQLADGSIELADGTTTLADGLGTAVEEIPTYSESERTRLADVVVAPVAAESASDGGLLTRSALPLLMAIVLLLGALATYLVIAPVTARALTSRRSSVRLALGGLIPGVIVGAVQGLAIAGIAQLVMRLDAGAWFALAGISVLAGVSFAAVVQGVVAVLRNAGRLVIALVAAIALAAGIISTAPALLLDLAGVLPTAAASSALGAIESGATGVGSAIGSLVLWGLIGFVLSTVAVVSRRTVTARQLSALSPSTR